MWRMWGGLSGVTVYTNYLKYPRSNSRKDEWPKLFDGGTNVMEAESPSSMGDGVKSRFAN